jgi:PPK2 family polyphosphate:nucleotide phosphotransferase
MVDPRVSATTLHRVKAGSKVVIAEIDPDGAPAFMGPKAESKARAEAELADDVARIAKLQEVLYAENKTSVLVVLQGMDTSGKDGVLRHVFSGINPQGCCVTSFKKPSEAEADRDFLWRIHNAVPARGEIGVFNRSHYEDVLIVRVHNYVPEKVWRKRYDMINDCERYLSENHIVMLKFFLHIDKDEQKERLQARLDDPEKRWKFNPADLTERAFWDDYQRAYEDVLMKCSTDVAPWFVIPANKKWYRNWAVARILRETLEALDPKAPKVEFDPKKIVIQ